MASLNGDICPIIFKFVVAISNFHHRQQTGLPAFFQASTRTVLDELADVELGGELEEDDAPQTELVDDFSTLGQGDILESNTFGDLNDSSLPDFFKNPKQIAEENYALFDSMANMTLADDSDQIGL